MLIVVTYQSLKKWFCLIIIRFQLQALWLLQGFASWRIWKPWFFLPFTLFSSGRPSNATFVVPYPVEDKPYYVFFFCNCRYLSIHSRQFHGELLGTLHVWSPKSRLYLMEFLIIFDKQVKVGVVLGIDSPWFLAELRAFQMGMEDCISAPQIFVSLTDRTVDSQRSQLAGVGLYFLTFCRNI